MTDRIDVIVLILQILQNTDKNTPLNSPQIQEKIIDLCNNRYFLDEIWVDRKTISKYIRHLQYLGYPIEQCKDKRRGWYYSEHLLTSWQVKILNDSILQSKCISNEESFLLQEKLLSILSDNERSKIRNMITPYTNRKVRSKDIGNYIELILDAIQFRRKIEFNYGDLDDNMNIALRRNKKDGSVKLYELNVYTLYWSNNTYYIIGMHDNHRDNLTSYRLDRVVDLRISKKMAVEAKKYLGGNPEDMIQHYIDTRVNNYGGKSYKLVLEFEYQAKYMNILFDFVGNDLMLSKLENGHIQARIVKQNSPNLMGWLMQYATIFKVIEPEEIKDELISYFEMGLKNYKK